MYVTRLQKVFNFYLLILIRVALNGAEVTGDQAERGAQGVGENGEKKRKFQIFALNISETVVDGTYITTDH